MKAAIEINEYDCNIDEMEFDGQNKIQVKNQPKQSQKDQRDREQKKNQRALGNGTKVIGPQVS